MTPVSYWESDPTKPDALHFERAPSDDAVEGFKQGEAVYLDVTNQLQLTPDLLTATYQEGGNWHSFTYPKCFFYYTQDDCATQRIKVRHAFAKIGPTHTYEPRVWDGKQMQLFGVWDVGLRRLHGVARDLLSPRRAAALVRRRVAGVALRSGGWPWAPDRRTLALGVIAGLTTVAVAAGQVGRIWRRGRAPLPSETEELLPAAQEAVTETVELAVAGYQDVSPRETATFNLLASFVLTFVSVRTVAWKLRGRDRVGPFRNFVIGRRHIHHFVPGILIAFGSGAAAIVTRDEKLEPKLAIPFGAGMGLTLDESALLLELEDVYWSPEGVLGVQISLAVTALLGTLILGVRFIRRGERVLAVGDGDGAEPPATPAEREPPAASPAPG